ncbi:MAG: hypothetical protein NVS2B4_18410 [Ramlibacter sp.]
MTDRFNFYDIYGYLLPGLVLGALVGLPFWLILGKGPPGELASAALALVLGYVLGHLLQLMAKVHLPEREMPSATLLRPADSRLSAVLKALLQAKVQKKLGVTFDLAAPDNKLVGEAFFLCRQDLLHSGRATYAEQFQGLYAMMRGFTLAFGAGAAYCAGLWLGTVCPWMSWFRCFGLTLVAWALLAHFRDGSKLPGAWRLWCERIAAMTSVLWLGAQVAWWTINYDQTHYHYVPSNIPGAAVVGASGCVLLAVHCWKGYRQYQSEFALAVYRGFLVEKPAKND